MTPPMVVAEYGQTMKGSIDVAHAQVDAAADAGAGAYKTQLLTPETIARADARAYWSHGLPATSQRSAFRGAGLIDYAAWDEVAAHAWSRGLAFCASPFDLDAVDALHSMRSDVVMKVASGDLTNTPLLRAVTQATGSGIMVVSTGASRFGEIIEAWDTINAAAHAGLRVFWLACTLAYPTLPADAELARITALLQRSFLFEHVGYSDHVGTPLSAACATALGARVLEVHTTLDAGLTTGCADDVHGLGPEALRRYVEAAGEASAMLGTGSFDPVDAEAPARAAARRSICAARDLPAFHELTADDLICLRPGDGIPPTRWDWIVGSRTRVPVAAGQALVDEQLIPRTTPP